VPNHPADLGQHDCILRSYMAQPAIWRLISGENSVDVDVRGRLSTNNVSMTLRFVEQGYGIAPLAPSIARPAFDTGMGSTRALDDWSFPSMPVHAVMTSRLVPARVRAFVDFLASRLVV
jgi:DNA-binding transcriptional LysR family regulator